MRILYVIGEPGAGKSTLMRALTAPLLQQSMPEPVPHRALSLEHRRAHAAELGVRRDRFSGTDALSMSIQPKAVRWLEGEPYPLIVAEGDRLANGKFFDAVLGMGAELAVLHVWAQASVTAARRAGRGGRQNPAWVQGRVSKVADLAGRYSAFPLEARLPAMVLAEHLLALPGPVGRMVRELREGVTRGPDVLVLPEQAGDGASAGLSPRQYRGAADAGDRAEEPEGVGPAAAADVTPNH